MSTLFWIQTGACGGDSLAILGAEAPTLEQLLTDYTPRGQIFGFMTEL